jgi:peptidyl-prolyl cis-trans isomerase C
MPPRRWHMLGLIFLPAFFCLESCGLRGRAQPENNPIVVRVGVKSYSKADLEHFFESRLSEFHDPGTADSAKSALLNSFVEEKLLLQKAEALKIEADPATLEKMTQKIFASGGGGNNDVKRDPEFERSMAESLKAQVYLRDHLFKNLTVTVEECEAYYHDHIGDFVRNDVVHVSEILVNNAQLAQKILASLKANRNRNFQELAKQYSRAPNALEGGDLGTFQRGELPDEFEKVIFPLAPGTISKIVSSQYGYHIFRVEEKILAHQQKYYEVEDQIQEKLLLERQRVAYEKELASLMIQFPVQVSSEKLDFNYSGFRTAARGGRPQ